jgi:hypothetical protein
MYLVHISSSIGREGSNIHTREVKDGQVVAFNFKVPFITYINTPRCNEVVWLLIMEGKIMICRHQILAQRIYMHLMLPVYSSASL